MFPWSHVCKNNNWLCLWMAASTVKLVLNKAWLKWALGPFSDLSQLPEFIHSLNRYFWGPTTNQAMQNINLPKRWQTRATHSFGRTVQHPRGHYVAEYHMLKHSVVVVLVQLFSRSVMCNSLWPQGLQHTRLPCPSPSPGAFSNSCPLSWWCHPTILSSVIPFSSCLQSFPASGFILNPMNSMKNTQWFDTNLLRGTELRGNIKWWNMHMVWLPSRISNPTMLYELIQKHLCLKEA